MAKKPWVYKVRHKNAFKRGLREASGVSKSSAAARLILGEQAVARDIDLVKKFYAAGRSSARAYAEREATSDELYAAAEREIDPPDEPRGFEVGEAEAVDGEADVDVGVADEAEIDYAQLDESDADDADDDVADADDADADEADDDDGDVDEADAA